MTISVVIPTYYRSRELARLLDSIKKQKVKPMEVIIVDDTPDDVIRLLVEDTVITARIANVDLKYIKNPKERSTSIARNIGAKIAKGDVVLFLDSDVVLHSGYIQGLLKTYEDYPEAVGIAGWIRFLSNQRPAQNKSYYFYQTLNKLFLLGHDSRDSCRFFEYPMVLTRTIGCQRFVGANMSFKRSLFTIFEFDETLKGYAFLEDALLSGLVLKKYRGKLLMTPDAICYHLYSQEGRERELNLRSVIIRNRKYVLVKLFGARGLLMFGWQNFGLLVTKLIRSALRKLMSPKELP